MTRFLLLLFAFAPPLLAQDLAANLLIDKTKPLAYLVFERVGTAKAHWEDGQERIFLRIVNNCKISLLFLAQGAEPDADASIEDEVLPEPSMLTIISSAEEESEYQRSEKLRKYALKSMPRGYSFEVYGVYRLHPGESMRVHFPRNHVSNWWFLRVRFVLDVGGDPLMSGPFTYLELRESDLHRKP